jgi:hypothetical protein
LPRKCRRTTNHHRCQDGKYALLVKRHKLTPMSQSPVSNCMPEQMQRGPISTPCDRRAIQLSRARAKASLSFPWLSKGERYPDNLVRVPPCRLTH